MLDFLLRYAIHLILVSIFFAFKTMRRHLKVARGRCADWTLDECQLMLCYDYIRAFGHPGQELARPYLLGYRLQRPLNPVIQFFYRWLFFFPPACLSIISAPLAWLYALLLTGLWWFIEHN